MTLLLLAAVLPALAPGDAGATAVKLPVPRVQYRINEAAATSSPWIDANGWRILRHPHAAYYYDVPAEAAALAAAEAFAYSANARIHTTPEGVAPFNEMLELLRTIPERNLAPVADIGVVDDGSAATGELMNLLSRRNLLYRPVRAPDPHLKLNVRIGSPEYPSSEAANPSFLAQKIRGNLGDENRSLRVYGSEVVIARLLASGGSARVHLLNYSKRPVRGLRVRVAGEYHAPIKVFARGDGARVIDVLVEGGATEFTLPLLNTYAVVDLSR